jgi:uncharacterized protein YecT (DUF1311 family)
MVFLLSCGSHAEDPKLRQLEARLEAAQSQQDMNIASGELARYLDKQLVEKEDEITKNMDACGLQLFLEASKLFRAYRVAQVSIEGDRYRGGSICPLMWNEMFNRMTRERLWALSMSFCPGGQTLFL